MPSGMKKPQAEHDRAKKLREPHARDTRSAGLEKTILDRSSVPDTAEALANDEALSQGPEVDLDNLADDEL